MKIHYLAPGLAKERRTFAAMLEVDLAHVVMLTETGIVSSTVGADLLAALLPLHGTTPEALDIDPTRGSMLLQVERHLAQTVGAEAAGALSTARSRIDQGATFRRMQDRAETLSLMDAVAGLQRTILALAAEHSNTVMPGYTHVQLSQPWVFGHYLSGLAGRIHDDLSRLWAAYRLTNLCPLGTVGGSGSSWPINRETTSDLLGFSGIIEHARQGRDIFYMADIAAAAAMLMADLNDFATDLQLWSSVEFGLVELDASYCGTSSIFPQKKNPVALEAVRNAAAIAVQWPANILSICRGMGSPDIAMRTAGFLGDALKTAWAMTDLLAGVFETLEVKAERMANRAGDGWTTASHLADEMVRDFGLSYRTAHHAVGAIVRHCIEQKISPNRLQIEDIETIPEFPDLMRGHVDGDWLRNVLNPHTFVAAAASRGGVAPQETARLLTLADATARIDETKIRTEIRRLEETRAHLVARASALAVDAKHQQDGSNEKT
ncbi:argininosuccinate lyase [Paracoccus onubensis]|uniref:argininosuccinate lyase n=1 Tax=Paracoccus onubensis TaxID=1675788 RepID=UPI00272FF860|nr:argininosuccinate lyase [Paracoccus onubensis]MDP0930067.1 argininosuccinate lyase [Paracoccus onubensis]